MFGVGLPEMMVILVVAVIAVGPNKLPEFARQAGRMIRQLRKLAKEQGSELREELGPQFADVTMADLNPRTAVRKFVLDAMNEADFTETGDPSIDEVVFALAPWEIPPYDVEAT